MSGYFMIASPAGDRLGVFDQVTEGVFAQADARKCPHMVECYWGALDSDHSLEGCEGLVAMVWDKPQADRLRALPFPVVNISNTAGEWVGMANVLSDDGAVGQLVAEHLLKRGYRSFLAIGQSDRNFSKDRMNGFRGAVVSSGGKVLTVELTVNVFQRGWSPARYLSGVWEQIGPMIERLPLEAGIFAVNDWVAWPVLRLLEEKAPERLYTTGLVGVDNMHDSLFDPRKAAGLSSVVPGFRQVGREALDILMDSGGDKAAVAKIRRRCPPEGIVERASSAGPACADPITAKVMRQMWAQLRAGQAVVIEDLARGQQMAPRTLERKFSQYLGRSAREWLATMRIDYARELLCNRSIPIGEVALRCGFADAPALSSAFKKATGMSPRSWRETTTAAPTSGFSPCRTITTRPDLV